MSVFNDNIALISRLHGEGSSTRHIFREILKIDPTVTYDRLRRFIVKMATNSFGSKHKYIPRSLKAFDVEAAIIPEIRDAYVLDHAVSAPFLQDHFKKQGKRMSISTIKRFRRASGLVRTSTKYCHSIRDVNKVNRLNFCTRMINASQCFNDWIFTDECTFQVENSVKFCYTLPGDYHARLKHRNKHAAKLHCWAGISKNGATALAIFDGKDRMNSENYCQILQDVLLPFIQETYAGHAVLAQDNAPTHTSRYTKNWLDENKVKTVDWPPESPDLNPIELVWGVMKSYIRKKNVRTVPELKEEMQNFWKLLTPEKCTAYINGIPRRMERVIDQQGRNIKESK